MRVRLGDVATYINGYAFKPSDWSDSGVPIIRIQDLTGNAYQANRYNGEYALKYEVNEGDVLISWSASLGVYIWAGEKAVLNQHIFKVVFDKEKINKSFFVHQVQNILEKAASEAHGATMKHLTKPVFDALSFYLPEMSKQAEIAAVLDQVNELISLRKQQLAKLDELVKARFVELFGDEQTFLEKSFHQVGDVCESKVGIVIQPTQYYTDNTDNSVKAFRSLNVKPFRVNDSDWVYFSAENNALMCRTQVHTNDVAVVRSGVNLGESCVIPCEYDGCNAIDILILSPGDKILPIYLMAFINYPHGRNQIINAQRGGALKHLNNKQLQEAHIFVPPIELQKQFAAFVEQTDKSKLTIQQSLDNLETLKKSLMQKYFG